MATGVAGLILAGGAGTRFGGPKAFGSLPGGRSFLVACAGTLAAAGVSPIVATLPAAGEPAEGLGFEALPLPEHGLSMFESLRTGLGRLLADTRWDRVVVLPVDHPLVRVETVRALAATEAAAAVPVHRGKHGHPVVLGRAVAEEVVNGALPGPTLREVLHSVDTADVAVDDPGVNANCNTPEVLAAALARGGSG
ncbi:MAG: NTP transferase domain-containing protein [Acidobacteriia bacterium]|nr:NTP transferase domain-containing protein [Terriglobia bacterium]